MTQNVELLGLICQPKYWSFKELSFLFIQKFFEAIADHQKSILKFLRFEKFYPIQQFILPTLFASKTSKAARAKQIAKVCLSREVISSSLHRWSTKLKLLTTDIGHVRELINIGNRLNIDILRAPQGLRCRLLEMQCIEYECKYCRCFHDSCFDTTSL
jgi:hypothetical protein